MAREETAPAPASSRPPAGHRRVVLHCDADAFFCQVERQLHPELYGSVTALAVFQHGDVIAADAGAKKLGVKKHDSPADARRALVPRGGALAHVHVTEGHRVSYRPYDKASKAMHRVLRSREMKDTLLRVCGFRNADVRERAEERTERATRDASSAESPLRSPSKARRGVVVEKASIDEAYVQLPSGCSLGAHAAACAHAVRRVVKQKTGLVLSVGAARNKTLAKFASAAAKPDGVKVVTEDDELGAAASSTNREIRVGVGVGVDTIDTKPERGSSVFISEPSLLRLTPCSKLRGCGGAGVAERMKNALRCETVADVAALLGDVDRVADRIVSHVGVPKPTALRVVNAARGVCDEPVRDVGCLKKSIGVHFSLAATPRRMPPEAVAAGAVSAAGGRPGWFEPVRVGERARVLHAVDAMSRDLAERVWDECEEEEEEEEEQANGDDDSSLDRSSPSETRARAIMKNVAPSAEKTTTARVFATRWPKTLVASVVLHSGGAVSRRGAFPSLPSPFEPGLPSMDGLELEQKENVTDVIANAAKALVDTATSRLDPGAIVAKLSVVASDIRPASSSLFPKRFDGGSRVVSDRPDDGEITDRANHANHATAPPRKSRYVSSFFAAVPAVAETAAAEDAHCRAERRDAPPTPMTKRSKEKKNDGSEPVDAGDAWRAFARGEMSGGDFRLMKRRRVEWLAERRRR
mmetsp:Transcript_5717/g.24237  ORF Transcript_5717/g.24237 Transcript_5717/m.24237 type:complete len:697 (-) Transcript_5717:63-2153(-)